MKVDPRTHEKENKGKQNGKMNCKQRTAGTRNGRRNPCYCFKQEVQTKLSKTGANNM